MSIVKLLSAGLISMSLVLGTTAIRASAAPVPEKKDDQKKDDPKKDDKKGSGDNKNPFGGALDDLLKGLGDGGGLTPEQVDQLRKELQKAIEQMQKQFPGGIPGGLPGGGLPGGLPGIMPGFPGLPGGFPGMPGFPNPTVRPAVREDTRLGAKLEKPSDTLVDQLDLPKGQGQVLAQLKDDSAAAKAGLKTNDILLELDGKPVSSDTKEFAKQLGDIKANTPVDAVVLRKGKKETIKGLSLPEDQKATPPKSPRLRLPGE